MISEYHLIYKLVNLKTCKIFKNNFKKKLQLLTCPFLKKPKPIITFIFTGTLKIEFFNHVFMLFFYFNNTFIS